MNSIDLVAVLAIIGCIFLPLVMVILIVWFRTNVKKKRYELQAELYSKALEKGQEIPKDLFPQEKTKKNNPLNTGIILISVGIGISLFLWLAEGGGIHSEAREAASVGLIPTFIGIAYLLIYFIQKKQEKKDGK